MLMKKAYWGLLALLIAALAIFVALSFRPDGVNVLGMNLKTGSFAHDLLVFHDNDSTQHTDSVVVGATGHPKGWRAPKDTTNQVILFIGDSMLEGLSPRLAAYCEQNGHQLYTVIWYSSSTEIWATSGRLKQLINEYKPTYIFVCLGANELFVKDIQKNRQRYLDTMLEQIGNIPFVWIGPPNWKPDTGINDMLQTTLDEGTFYLSNGQQFERNRDGAHPTRAAAAAWCDRVCKWIGDKGMYPFNLTPPVKARGKATKIIVYQPVN